MEGVPLKKYVETYGLQSMTPEISAEGIMITVPEVCRPSFPLTGFFERFESKRVQIIGNAERDYIHEMTEERRQMIFDRMVSYRMPCIIYTQDREPDDTMLECCRRYGVPCYLTKMRTSELMSETIRWLKVELAPTMTVHGVLMDVFGEGVLITGESGIGKSEAALELIKRGHRLVSDDVVELKKVSEATIIGTSPSMIRHFIELRGIGIIDVKALYGVECVKDTQQLDMVIMLEDWDKNKQYDRLGLEDHYIEYLGNQIVCHELPIRPGRNLAIICETAAVNHRQKKMGYNAAKELTDRTAEMISKGGMLD